MASLKGSRTIVVAIALALASRIGLHITGSQIDWLIDVITLGMPAAMILMRMFTSTPIGQKAIADAEQAGVPPELVDKLVAGLPKQADMFSLISAIEVLHGQIAAMPPAAVAAAAMAAPAAALPVPSQPQT